MSQRLGDLLVKEKVITPEQLEQATKLQKDSHSRLASALPSLRLLRSCTVTFLLALTLTSAPVTRAADAGPVKADEDTVGATGLATPFVPDSLFIQAGRDRITDLHRSGAVRRPSFSRRLKYEGNPKRVVFSPVDVVPTAVPEADTAKALSVRDSAAEQPVVPFAR